MTNQSNNTSPAAPQATDTVETTFPVNYWPISHPIGGADHECDMREVTAALFLAVKGLREDGDSYFGDPAAGLEWLAMAAWHMAIQMDEHGKAAGKGGAA